MTQKVEVADVESISLGRRFREIIQEKGKAFSLRAMEMKTGITKATLLRIMNGERYFKPTEIEIVAKSLDMTVERFKGSIVKEKLENVTMMVSNRSNLKKALELAQEVMSVVIGCTEKFSLFNNLGAIYFLLNQYGSAKQSYQQALSEAQKIRENYGDTLPLYKVSANLVDTYVQQKDFFAASALLNQIEEYHSELDPNRAGDLSYSHAMIAYHIGDLEQCKIKMYEHCNYYESTEVPLFIGIGNHNVGYIEYLLGNYHVSKLLFEKAMNSKKVAGVVESRLLSAKDYVKCILRLEENDEALLIIDSSIKESEIFDLPTLKAKFVLLRAIATGNIEDAEAVLVSNDLVDPLRLLACDLIMKYCAKHDDSTKLLKYYKIAEQLKKSAKIDWEGL